jgi:hypothetical protein
MRRSGTSSLSLVLNRLGVAFGAESQRFRGDDFNAEGYWEHKSLTAINRRFRASLNLVSVDCDPTPEDWRELPATEHFVRQGVDCLRTHFLSLPPPWAWKDPDASLALPFVYEVGKRIGLDPFLLIAVRHPSEVAQSELRRKGAPELQTIGAWLAHTLNALHDSRFRRRSIVVFSELMRDPRQVLESPLKEAGIVPSDAEWAEAQSAIRPDLVHGRAELSALDTLPPLVGCVYDLCLRAAKGFDLALDDEIESCYREFECTRQMFWRPPLEEATLAASWKRGLETRFAEVPYRATSGWQTVTIETGALPASPVKLFLYPLPANVWIRRAVWRYRDQISDAVLESGSSGNLSHRFGLASVSLLHGPDHLIVKTPSAKGPFALELEFLIETNSLIVGETYKFLSERLRSK